MLRIHYESPKSKPNYQSIETIREKHFTEGRADSILGRKTHNRTGKPIGTDSSIRISKRIGKTPHFRSLRRRRL